MPLLPDAKRRLRRNQLQDALKAAPTEAMASLGVTADAVKALQEQLVGQIVLPGDPGWSTDVRGNSMYPQLATPQMIVYCEVVEDVAECLDFARTWKLEFAVRSGGHSSAGYCVDGGMVIDMSRFDGVFVMPDRTSVLAQAGADLGKLYATLEPYGLHVPGGECDTVGVAGHMMGGGYGFTSRAFGLNCDAVERVWMMLADGSVVRADATVNQDLFWAVRGATGGNLGVLLQVQYRTVPLGNLWGFTLRWPADESPAVLVELQKSFVRSGVTPELGYQLCFGQVDGQAWFYMMGMYNGAPADGKNLLAPLQAIGSPTMTLDTVGQYKDLNGELLSWFQMPPKDTWEVKDCNYIAAPLSEDQWRQIVDYYKTAPNPFNLAAMEVYGGAATAGPAGGNAFIHRDVDFDLFMDSFCNENWAYNDLAEAEAWLSGFNALVEQFSNGEKYQDYPRRGNANYRWNYWADAYPTLLAVKAKYDPTNFFTFEQGITPYPDDPGIRRSDAESLFPDSPIVYEVRRGSGG